MSAAVSPITRQSVGRTFIIAISILGIGALSQMGAVGWLFFARFRVAPVAAGTAQSGAVQGGTAPARDFSDPFAEASLPAGTVSPVLAATPAPPQPLAPPAPPRPSPILQPAPDRQAKTTDPTQQDRFNELIEQGRLLRQRDDSYAAVTTLREAQVIDPKNPVALAELAMTYDKMGFAEKASEYWKRIYDMGPSAGVYYEAAKGKLESAKTLAMGSSSGRSEVVGLSPASKFGIGDITRTDENDPQAMRKFVLHVPVKAKPRVRIDAADVVVKVEFFDLVNNNPTLERTKAEISYRWVTPPADWVDEDVETLDVTYTLPKPPQGEPMEDRKFYGFITTVYYKNALQDFKSDPARLSQKAPPPRSLPQDVVP